MNRKLFAPIVAMIVLALSVPASASLVFNTGPNSEGSIDANLNAFKTQLNALGLVDIVSGELKTTVAGRLEFWYHGQESGWNNSFLAYGEEETESGTHENPDWDDDGIALPLFTIDVLANHILDLAFSTPLGGQHDIGTSWFGIFVQSNGSIFANNGRVYFGHDDSGAEEDDNHDDMIISMRFTPVPEASTIAVWSILASIGGIAAYKKRKAAAAA